MFYPNETRVDINGKGYPYTIHPSVNRFSRPLRLRQLYIQAYEIRLCRYTATVNAFKVEEDLRELLSLALLICHDEGGCI